MKSDFSLAVKIGLPLALLGIFWTIGRIAEYVSDWLFKDYPNAHSDDDTCGLSCECEYPRKEK